jgi:hypothetical protein
MQVEKHVERMLRFLSSDDCEMQALLFERLADVMDSSRVFQAEKYAASKLRDMATILRSKEQP